MTQLDLTIRPATNVDQKAWDANASHPLQSWAWGKFRKAMGVDVVQLSVLKGNKLVKGWQMTFHRLPHTPWTIGYFPRGPMPTRDMLATLAKLGKEKNAIFIQLESNALANFKFQISNFKLLKPSHHPLFPKYTFVLDLTKSEDELIKGMHHKTRYNIRVAEKYGVIVKQNHTPEAFAAYQKLSGETAKRHGFYAHDEQYHNTLWKILANEKLASLWTAEYQGETLAACILFLWKDTIYYPYGASSRNHREVMAPNLLLWEIAKWGKRNGFKKFDLWGALGSSTTGKPNPNDPWFGFHKFKAGYHPELVEFLCSYDLVLQPMLYKLYAFADKLRWLYLKIRK